MLEAAVARGRAAPDAEVAALAERLRVLDAVMLQSRQELLRLQELAEARRGELETAGHDRARLAERASRVPALEAQVARLDLQLRIAHEEVQRLAASEAQKAQALASLAEQMQQGANGEAHIDEVLRPIRQDLEQVRQRLDQALHLRPPRVRA